MQLMTMEQIREKLNDPDINQADVARKVGCTRAYINFLKEGRRDNPSMRMVEKLSEALDNG